MKYITIAVFLLLVSGKIYSQTLDSIVPDRPGQTNPPNTVPVGMVQLETGFSSESSKTNHILTRIRTNHIRENKQGRKHKTDESILI